MYLAFNLNDYKFALYPAAAEEDAGIRSTAFHKYFQLLEIEGYVVWRHGNVFDFYPVLRLANERTHHDKQSFTKAKATINDVFDIIARFGK